MAAQHIPVISQSPAAFHEQLADLLASYLAAYNLLGRLHALQEVKRQAGVDVQPMNTLTPITFADDEVLGFESVPNQQAIERIRNLTSYTKLAFDALKERYKLQAFTVAGISNVRLIENIQSELARILEDGGTVRDFERAVDALTSEAGVEDLTRRHLETIFQTNIQRAYQGGKFEQMKDPAVTDALPYWRYVTAGDGRVRPAHAALEGFTARHDDLVWGRIYPPNGYNCRCTVIAVLPDDVDKDADLPGSQRIPWQAAGVPDPGFGGER